jgi:GTPase SAR1 family protein
MPFKVAICGTYHSGKTSFCHRVVAELKSKNYNAELTRESARKSYYLAVGERNIYTQVEIFARQISEEIEYLRINDILICDRCLIDILAYTRFYMKNERNPNKIILGKSIESFSKEYLKTYDLIFLKRTLFNLKLSSDSIRLKDTAHQNIMFKNIIDVLNDYGIQYHSINRNTSIKQVTKTIVVNYKKNLLNH